ncbi:MAG: ROK family protein [Clostridiales bacterium]|nr:ROK family protein [Clostridiales bacterium]
MLHLGIDIGGTKVALGLVNENNELVLKGKLLVKDIDNIVQEIKNFLDVHFAENNISFAEIASCGIGVPGTVSDDGRTAIKVPNLNLENAAFAEEFENVLGMPVTLVQDSRAAAYGEYCAGNAKGCKTVICIALGTGIGTGVVIDGKIYNGALGAAGELGHVPAVEGGRPCGCGKVGCVEKYAAGRGLDITAAELLGEGKTAKDLFEAAENGCEKANALIGEAVEILGRTIVSACNLLSPDCVLFTGGLVGQKKLYIEPLIAYINEHVYSSGKMPKLEIALLDADAPLVGAAIVGKEYAAKAPAKRKALLSASVMCADLLNLGASLKEIEQAGIEYIHADIMDNHFVPNLMLPMEMYNKMRPATNLPFDFHIMAENPETIIEKLDLKAGDIVSVHYESTVHLQRALTMVKEKGAIPAVAINPATPLEMISEVIDEVGMVLIMTVNPGFAGQKIVPGAFDKVRRTREWLDKLGKKDVLLQVDGNCSFENVPKLYNAGADVFVVGTSSVFKKGLTIKEGTDKLLSLL